MGNERETISPRGFTAERVVVSTLLDPYMSLKALSDYSGMSRRTLLQHINDDPFRALPAYRVRGGKLLVRRSEFDEWMAAFKTTGRPAVAEIVEALRRFQGERT